MKLARQTEISRVCALWAGTESSYGDSFPCEEQQQWWIMTHAKLTLKRGSTNSLTSNAIFFGKKNSAIYKLHWVRTMKDIHGEGKILT